MDTHLSDEPEVEVAETPEDVAILYSWANLHGAKYRDFSASRREYRAQVRHRAAEELRQSELAAQAEAEQAAAEAERMARAAERAARSSERHESPYDRERALRDAEDAGRRATAERVEAARRAETAAMAEAATRREEREIAEAHASAQRQAARWNDSEIRRRSLAGPQPARVPALGGDPYEVPQGATVDGHLPTPNLALEYTQPRVYRDDASGVDQRRTPRGAENDVRRPRGFQPDQPSGIFSAYKSASAEAPARSRVNNGSEFIRVTPGQAGLSGVSARNTPPAQQDIYTPATQRAEERVLDRISAQNAEQSARGRSGWQASAAVPAAPAWLFGSGVAVPAAMAAAPQSPARSPISSGAPAGSSVGSGPSSVSDTLQHSRERVASRWFALKGVFDNAQDANQEVREREPRTPMLAVFSLAGGVGKTSLVATLGRALSSLGEKVLLADTTSHGLLPYYFGATELKTGVTRTFSPPSGSADAPINLVSYEADDRNADRAAQDALAEQVSQSANGVQRLLVDFNAGSGWLIRRLPRMTGTVLIPVAADMNSVISLQAVEKYFQGAMGADGQPLLPFYVLNQFDAGLPLHLDVREVLRRQLGDRLLPYSIRRSPAVSEALAEGMTVVDYQPDAGVSEDYLNVAKWLRSVSAPAAQGTRNTRWSER